MLSRYRFLESELDALDLKASLARMDTDHRKLGKESDLARLDNILPARSVKCNDVEGDACDKYRQRQLRYGV